MILEVFFDPNNDKKKDFLLSNMIDKIFNIIGQQFITQDIEIIKNIEDITILSLENELNPLNKITFTT